MRRFAPGLRLNFLGGAQTTDFPLSVVQGRGAGFPGKRRPRGAGLSGRGGRGRSKLKGGMGAVVVPGVRPRPACAVLGVSQCWESRRRTVTQIHLDPESHRNRLNFFLLHLSFVFFFKKRNCGQFFTYPFFLPSSVILIFLRQPFPKIPV